jgi:hypothetical protein
MWEAVVGLGKRDFSYPQADPFPTGSESSIAGVKRESKIGLLRSVTQTRPGRKMREWQTVRLDGLR